MRNMKILSVILAIALVFGMTACDDGGGPDGSGGGGSGGPSSGGVWTAVTNSSLSGDILDITYGNNTFVAVSKYNNMSDSKISYSSDGIKWTEIPSNYSYRTNDTSAIAYGNNMFVAGGKYGKTSNSTDVLTWTNTIYAKIGDIETIAYGNGQFVAGGYSGGIAYSSDGVTWTTVANSTFGNDSISKIVWGNGKFVAGGNKKMAYSSDGINWTAVTNSSFLGTYDYITTIAYGNGKFVAGSAYGKMAYSSDGINWTAVANSPFNYPYEFGDSYFDLIDVVSASIHAIAYGNSKFVALNVSGKTAVSSDGSTWTVISDSVFGKTMPDLQYGGDLYNNQIMSIVYGNGKFVVGGRGKVAYWSGK